MDRNITTKITEQFRNLGISKSHARLYLELWISGPLTVVQLSRQLSYGRNKVYRLLNDLQEFNLVNKIKKTHGSRYEALHYKNLKPIVEQKRKDLVKAQDGLNGLFQDLPFLQKANAVSSNVIHYYGIEGLKQVNWNLVHTKGTFRVYEVSRVSDYLDEEFAEELRIEWLKRKIYNRDLTNDTFIDSCTKVSEFVEKFSEYRHISPEILKISTEIYIYNDVVTVLQYDALEYNPKSVFCVEIYNAALAEVQRQIYDILWEQAEKFRLVDESGKRVLEKS